MTDREAALKKISAGDMFHASVDLDGPSYPCLALQVRENAIFARRVTTQWSQRRASPTKRSPAGVAE